MPASEPHRTKARTRRKSQRPNYVSISTVAQLGTDCSQQDASDRLLKITGRKSSKNLRDSPEAVWPHEAEAALLQGLEAYYSLHFGFESEPGTKRKNMRRNKFLADFIAEKTNVPRNAKQVGSRLQQLRGSTQDERVKRLILGRPVPEVDIKPLTTTRPLATSEDIELRDPKTPFQVKIRLHSARHPSLPPVISLASSPSSPPAIQLAVLSEWLPFTRLLKGMSPTIVIVSPTRLKEHCQWRVSLHGSYWMTPADLNCDSMSDGKWRYTANFAADLWNMICDDQNEEWKIQQSVFSAEKGVPPGSRLVTEIVYTFEADGSRPTLKALRGGGTATAKRKSVKPAPQIKSTTAAVLHHEMRNTVPALVVPNKPSTTFSSLADWDKMPRRLTGTAHQAPPASNNANQISVHVDPQTNSHLYSRGGFYDPQLYAFHFTDRTQSHFTLPGGLLEDVESQVKAHNAAYSMTGEFLGWYPPYNQDLIV
ncbi:hypothetical protein C8J57DRAFT_1217468 [Mycena rebaudengoi]|nr:hypothetical protein C8J57DRAFT_1217468 [Mycena rebaudengoi]